MDERAVYVDLSVLAIPAVEDEVASDWSARTPSRPWATWILRPTRACFASEPDPQVRALLIDLVAPAAAKDPRAMQALAEQFRRESDPTLLRQIGRYVPADKLGS